MLDESSLNLSSEYINVLDQRLVQVVPSERQIKPLKSGMRRFRFIRVKII